MLCMIKRTLNFNLGIHEWHGQQKNSVESI